MTIEQKYCIEYTDSILHFYIHVFSNKLKKNWLKVIQKVIIFLITTISLKEIWIF